MARPEGAYPYGGAEVVGTSLVFVLKTAGTEIGYPTINLNLPIDPAFGGPGRLSVESDGIVGIIQTLNALDVQYIGTAGVGTGPTNVFLATEDAPSAGQDINVTGQVQAQNITFTAGDDFTQVVNGFIRTSGSVAIQVDPPAGDADPTTGASVTPVADEIFAKTLSVTGGDQIDTFNIAPDTLGGGNAIQVNGDAPSYPTYPGDLLVANGDGQTAVVTVTNVKTGSGNVVYGGGYAAVDFANIEEAKVNGQDAPPVNVLPANSTTQLNPVVLSGANGDQIVVADPDAGSATDSHVRLASSVGTLSLLADPGLTVTGLGTAGSPLLIVGSLAEIDQDVATGLTVAPGIGYLGTAAITVFSDDEGNTGAGGPLTDTSTVDVTFVESADQPPAIQLPPPSASTADPVVLSAAGGNAVKVTDPDAGTATNYLVQLSVANGTPSLPSPGGVTVTGTGTPGSVLQFVGSLAATDAALATGLDDAPPAGFQVTTTLDAFANDEGNTGPGGPLTATAWTTITVQVFNQPPANTVPGATTTDDQTPITFSAANGNGFSVDDPESPDGAGGYTITLSDLTGTLSLATAEPAGVTVTGSGAAGRPITLTGTLAAIDAAPAAGVVYTPAAGTAGADTITVVSNDGGNFGLGGPMTDTSTVAVTVTLPLNQPPVDTPPPAILTGQTTIDPSNADGDAISVTATGGGAGSTGRSGAAFAGRRPGRAAAPAPTGTGLAGG